jgi:hypothetical protein
LADTLRADFTLFADHAAFTTVCAIRVDIHALSVTVGEAILTGKCALTAGANFARFADIRASSTMFDIGLEIDTIAVAVCETILARQRAGSL